MVGEVLSQSINELMRVSGDKVELDSDSEDDNEEGFKMSEFQQTSEGKQGLGTQNLVKLMSSCIEKGLYLISEKMQERANQYQ